MIIAQFSVAPVGEGVSLSKYIKEVVKIINETGFKFKTNPMSTTVEIDDLKSLFDLIEKLNNKLFKLGILRVITDIKIDYRKDKNATMKSKLNSIN
jgi:uncharacterized protein (TIGR00106 family)